VFGPRVRLPRRYRLAHPGGHDPAVHAVQLELPPRLSYSLNRTHYLHEQALRLQVGGPATQAAQVKQVRSVADRGNVRIRIVPESAGAHAGMAGSFTHLGFPAYESLMLVEHENSSLFIEAKDAVRSYETPAMRQK
jgi:hypothetical protein